MPEASPFSDTYWVRPGIFLAGCYPLLKETVDGRQLRAILRAGINEFIDLTREGELPAYEAVMHALAAEMGADAGYQRFAIMDFGTHSPMLMGQILDCIDQKIAQGRKIYLHCWGGIGRTGTVVGCHLVRGGLNGASALAEIQRLRANVPDWYRSSPETPEQREMVLKGRDAG